MITVKFYYKKNDARCEQALADLQSIQETVPHQLAMIDIEADNNLKESFTSTIPVVQAGPFRLQAPFTRQELLVALSAARDRHNEMKDDKTYQKRLERSASITTSDHISYWLSKHYMAVFNSFLMLFVGFPFMAPILMKLGIEPPARVIYLVYSPLCHQLAYRSFFLFGEQLYYPRSLAHIPWVKTFEEVSKLDSYDTFTARQFDGNSLLGFKVAICERDVAIYCGMLFFGLLFSRFGRKWKSIPWYAWVILGIIPMGLDGGSQLPSLVSGVFPAWFPLRESTPLLRVLTGGLFGITTAWYLFPYVEDSMKDTRSLLDKKFAILKQLANQKAGAESEGDYPDAH